MKFWTFDIMKFVCIAIRELSPKTHNSDIGCLLVEVGFFFWLSIMIGG